MKKRYALIVLLLFLAVACDRKDVKVRDEFATPEKTYEVWIDAGVRGDLARSMECITTASRRMMDQQAKSSEEFVRRMVANAAVFKTFSIIDKKVSGSKGVLLTESPDKKAKIAVPFLLEPDGWKVDLVGMFGG